MSKSKVDCVLNFLNIFLKGNNLEKIDDVSKFSVEKSLLINSKNVSLYTMNNIDEMSKMFDRFRDIHERYYDNYILTQK